MIKLNVNDKEVAIDAPPMKRLLDALREDCGLTGTKEGCGEGECGACTVLVDGKAVVSCLVPVAQVEGAEIQTIEGLGGEHPLQRAFVEAGGAQCGICTPGMIMAAMAMGSAPSLEDVRVGLAGNICRCTGYEAIYRAIEMAYGNGTAGNGTAGNGIAGNGYGRGNVPNGNVPNGKGDGVQS